MQQAKVTHQSDGAEPRGQPCVVGDHNRVAAQRQRQPGTDAGTFDRRHHRKAAAHKHPHDLMRHPKSRPAGGKVRGVHAADVAARAEMPAGARQDNGADGPVRLDRQQRRQQRVPHRKGQRIAPGGVIERQNRDRPLMCVLQHDGMLACPPHRR